MNLTAPPCQATHFVRGLRLQLGEDVLRLRLRSERHVDGRVGMLRGWRIGGQVAVGIIVVVALVVDSGMRPGGLHGGRTSAG